MQAASASAPGVPVSSTLPQRREQQASIRLHKSSGYSDSLMALQLLGLKALTVVDSRPITGLSRVDERVIV